MELNIYWPDRAARPLDRFVDFLQKMVNRKAIGGMRYGPPHNSQKYLSRLKAELKTYEKTGNAENLINIANYAFLESFAPEHPQAHFNNLARSATRHRFGGERREGD